MELTVEPQADGHFTVWSRAAPGKEQKVTTRSVTYPLPEDRKVP